MRVDLECGCRIDDEFYSTYHEPKHTIKAHFPIGTSPKFFCRICDLYEPCCCGCNETEHG